MKSRIRSVKNDVYFDFLKCKIISEVQDMVKVTVWAILEGQRQESRVYKSTEN